MLRYSTLEPHHSVPKRFYWIRMKCSPCITNWEIACSAPNLWIPDISISSCALGRQFFNSRIKILHGKKQIYNPRGFRDQDFSPGYLGALPLAALSDSQNVRYLTSTRKPTRCLFGAVIARYQAAEYAKRVFTYPLHSSFACVIFSHCEEVLGFVSLG